jgi:hypothetical protein
MEFRILVYLCSLLIYYVDCVKITNLGSFKISDPAFVTLYENPNGKDPKDKYDFVISTFSAIPFATDTVGIVKGIGHFMDNVPGIKPETLTTQATWPNEAAGVPGMRSITVLIHI